MALWQIGESEFVGPELNRAFVDNNERLDPAMAALARAIGVPNVELRASEDSAARGIMLTGLFPVPPYSPEGGYHIDNSLVLAFARIESRFQTGRPRRSGARGLMQLMPATAAKLGVTRSRHALRSRHVAGGGPALYRATAGPAGRQSAGAGRRL